MVGRVGRSVLGADLLRYASERLHVWRLAVVAVVEEGGFPAHERGSRGQRCFAKGAREKGENERWQGLDFLRTRVDSDEQSNVEVDAQGEQGLDVATVFGSGRSERVEHQTEGHLVRVFGVDADSAVVSEAAYDREVS